MINSRWWVSPKNREDFNGEFDYIKAARKIFSDSYLHIIAESEDGTIYREDIEFTTLMNEVMDEKAAEMVTKGEENK